MHPLAPLTLFALTAPMAAAVGEPAPLAAPLSAPIFAGQITIRERIIVRVPRLQQSLPVGRAALPTAPRWKEKKGPKCVAAADLNGAMVSQPGSVDLVFAGGDRVRAILDDDCGPLDYYSGFYLRPATDGQICADRDAIRVRSGATCAVKTFKRLVPAR